jgi:predicted ester cyclase
MNSQEQANTDLCIRVNQELFGDARLELAQELISPDFVDHEAPEGFPTGPEAARSTVNWLHGAFADMRYEVEDAFGSGDRVALRVTLHATHAREFMGKPATGRRFTMGQTHIFRIDDGKVAEHWANRDDAGLMRQLSAA